VVRGFSEWEGELMSGEWFMVCMGNGVENRFVVAHNKANGRWDLRSSMRHDELSDMGHLVSMKKEAY
jgi:hypothetical protein